MSDLVSTVVDLLTDTKANLSDGSDEVILGPVSEESESYSADIPMSAVENGTDVGDHVHAKPGSFSISTFLCDSFDLATAALSLITGMDNTSVRDKIDKLKEWEKSGTLLTYSGPVFSNFITPGYDMIVEDVAISSLKIVRSLDTASGISVSIALSNIPIVNAELTSIAVTSSALRSVSNQGASTSGSTSAATSSASGNSSVLARMFL